MKGKVIKIYCQCSKYLFKYFKDKRGKLIKCYLDEIRVDNVGVSALKIGDEPTCPVCKKPIGVCEIINGRPAIKLNQGTIKGIVT